MARQSKRARAIEEKIDRTKAYPIEEAVNLLSEISSVKFKEAFDVSVNLGVDPRKSDQVVRGATTLPHGVGKTVRVAVFTQGENVDKA
ncbi:MAG: 50S ribosomal protein L1, partial [Gammaproteobacteria bacterium]|nr:50S ribosomal protein L1 [Gammaproteobacteria bacterium]